MERGTRVSYVLLLVFVLEAVVNLVLVQTLSESTPVVAIQFLGLLTFALFVGSLVLNVITYVKYGKPKDIWKLGFMGFLGLLGFLPSFGAGFFGLYGFYGFLGFKKN